MPPERAALERVVEEGEQEDGSIEFKVRLRKDTHLDDGKRESLVAQMRHRVLSGDGTATYVVGVTDDGGITGIDHEEFSESMDVLSLIAEEADARITNAETWHTDEGRIVGMVTISDGGRLDDEDDHILVGTAGHVDHGKSTLVGSLITGEADDGAGDMRRFLDTRPHEQERGLSATLTHAVYGFDEKGNPITMDDPTRDSDRASVIEDADRLVSFVDTVGHDPWLKTTIRGLVGQKLDYGLLTVAADDGPTKTTREHLGILLATNLPVIVSVTKKDIVDDEQLEMTIRTIERHLRDADKTPLRVSRTGVNQAIEELSEDVVPIVTTSSVTRDGLDSLNEMFSRLPKTQTGDGDFRLYIDQVYDVRGVGAVVSGSITSGRIEKGDTLLVGPMKNGEFRTVEAQTIEMHHQKISAADAGRSVGVNLTGIDADELERGMVLLPGDADPSPVKEFKAEIMVLNHPTSINDGYEPVVHLETMSETAVIHPEDGQLLPGDTGEATVELKFEPQMIEVGQQFLFREGQAKGVGKVTEITETDN